MEQDEQPPLVIKIALVALFVVIAVIDIKVLVGIFYSEDTFLGLCVFVLFHCFFIIWIYGKYQDFKKGQAK